MTVLVYLICAIASPSQCEEHRAPAPSVMACALGQAELAAQIGPGCIPSRETTRG